MNVGEGAHPHAKVATAPDQFDQLGGVLQPTLDRLRRRARPTRHVTPHRENVTDPDLAVGIDRLLQLVDGLAGAGQVAHHPHVRGGNDVAHCGLGAIPRGAVGPVGDGHEVRPQRLESLDCQLQLGVPGVVLGGEELETERRR